LLCPTWKQRIAYTSHALLRIYLRAYSKEVVEDALLHPDSISDAREGRRKATKRTTLGIISVIYIQEDNITVVITVYPGE